VVQYNVDVTLHREAEWPRATAPRVVGQPVVYDPEGKLAQRIQALDIQLSSAKIELPSANTAGQQSASHLTFFLDTRTPEKLRALELPLMFRTNEVEHDIVDVGALGDPGADSAISRYQASSWLSFILPRAGDAVAENPNYIGAVEAPVPLRSYPIPPSLALQRAEADPDSFARLAQIREWQYTYVYEHLDAAQDTIESRVSYEPITASAAAANGLSEGNRPLFEALVRFAKVYPLLLPDLSAPAPQAVATFASLAGQVASAWALWEPTPTGDARRPQFAISEAINPDNAANKDVTIRWVDA
jgi:hypothetical protein